MHTPCVFAFDRGKPLSETVSSSHSDSLVSGQDQKKLRLNERIFIYWDKFTFRFLQQFITLMWEIEALGIMWIDFWEHEPVSILYLIMQILLLYMWSQSTFTLFKVSCHCLPLSLHTHTTGTHTYVAFFIAQVSHLTRFCCHWTALMTSLLPSSLSPYWWTFLEHFGCGCQWVLDNEFLSDILYPQTITLIENIREDIFLKVIYIM